MVDGTGMCGSCRVTVGGEVRFACVDGPDFDAHKIDFRELLVRDAGVRFETNKVIGKTVTIERLTGAIGFDAVFVAAGAGAPTFRGIPGESAGQVYSGNELLTRINLMGGDRFPYRGTPIALGERVIVIGAGNTAMDCLRTARRLGAPEVRCVYRRSEAEAPARTEELRHAKDERTQATNLRGVFAGGNIVTGGATVILATAAGRRAARAIGARLQQGGCDWPPAPESLASFELPRPEAPPQLAVQPT